MKNEYKWKVYIHVVPHTGYDKYYVGITLKSDPEKRWEHGYGYRGNEHFFRAIQKYGWDNIKHIIFINGVSKEEACNIEKMLISTLRSKDPKYGYNKTDGGEGTCGVKISEAQREKKRQASLGEKNPYYGKKHSEETRAKMRKNHWKRKYGEMPTAKRVHQFDLNCKYIKTYGAIQEAADIMGVCDMCIHHAIKSHGVCKGFFWGKDDDVVEIDGKIHLKEMYSIPSMKKQIYQFSENGGFITVFRSLREAGRKTGIFPQNIGRSAKMHRLSGGYYWRYEDDIEDFIDKTGSFYIA